ncbi:GNAT family N-acetyltransferase [Streptomyces platensis]|uniref:GNAT family N-acetyltransferase n=1 Tax=Streptomyces platensis TaxID=58346 RepID=UPI001F18539A|nr:GNAT family N-acetyltransferase [Streptomyces platensis]MCF3143638.1 GNAT family N-acetyltransferase [Streptomyces platensis]
MVTLRTLTPNDAPALTRIYSGTSIQHTTGKPLTLDQAHEKIRTALARATETPRAQWSWGIVATDEMIGLIALRRRTPSMGTLSYILREDTWGNGYATEAVKHVVAFAFTTVSLERLEAMHHPDNPASGRVLAKAGFTRTGTSDRCVEDGPAVPYQVYALPLPRAPLPR